MIIKNISKTIQETLKNRERALARKTDYANTSVDGGTLNIADLAARTTFVRMISNKSEPVRKRVIQGGELAGNTGTAFNLDVDSTGWQPYHSSDEEGIRPISGINDIVVEYKGGYKAIRQATINWTANSLFDLDDLTPHFLAVGKTVLLEWGWVMKNQKLESFFNPITGEISEEAFSNPMPLILRNRGNYDAMAGVISNYEYTLNETGGFNCTTTLTSIGTNLFESQKADSRQEFKNTTSEVGEKKQAEVEDSLINAIINIDEIAFYSHMEAKNNLETGNLIRVNRGDFETTPAVTTTVFQGGSMTGTGPSLKTEVVKDAVKASNNLKHIYTGEQSDTGHHHAISTKKTEGIASNVEDVYFTTSTVSFDPNSVSKIQSSQDIYVRWGWFEDNIISRYTSFAQNKNSPLVNIFRSVEIALDENGNPEEVTPLPLGVRGLGQTLGGTKQYAYKPVLIRNNPKYLLPKNPMKFFLPGQQIKFDAIEGPFGKFSINYTTGKEYYLFSLFGDPVTIDTSRSTKDANKNGKHLEPWLKEFLNINSALPFASNNKNYGVLRNVMVNTKEIKEAFGINSEKTNNTDKYGKLYYSDDGINPVSTVKKGMERLLSALSANFFNYWNFKIVVDPLNGNMKVIDTHSTPYLTSDSKRYTKFQGDPPSTNPPSHVVNNLGIYKFPAFKAGSFVKTQNLAFKIPDSMAVTAMYETNKNKGGGVVMDTANESAHIATVFTADQGDSYKDAKLKGLEKAYQIGDEFEGHNIGSSKITDNIDQESEQIKFNNSFDIDPRENVSPWWCTWTTAPKETDENVLREASQEKGGTYRSPRKFLAQLQFMLQGNDDVPNDEVEKIKAKNDEIHKEISQIYNGESTEYPGPTKLNPDGLEENDTYGAKTTIQGDSEWPTQSWERVQELENQLQIEQLEGKYYTFKSAENTPGYELSLFAAGEAVVKAKLFGYDKESSAYQTSFVIPAELSLTVDGIAGIIPGDIIQTDYIQPKYNQSVIVPAKDGNTDYGPLTFFQIFNISQKVSSNGWETEIGTKMRVNDQVISNLHAGEIQEILLPKSPAKLRKEEGVKLIPPLERTYTQPPSEEVDVPLLDLDELDDFPDFSDLEAPPPPPEKVDINLDVDVDEDSLYQQKVAEEVGAAVLAAEGNYDELFGDTDPGEGVVYDEDEDTGDDNWDEDYNKENPIEVVKVKQKKEEVKNQKPGGQGTVTVKTEKKMIKVFPGSINNITVTSVKQNQMPERLQGSEVVYDDVRVSTVSEYGRGGYHSKHGWYIASGQGGKPDYKQILTVIIRSSYRPDDGSSGEQREFTAGARIGSGRKPYSAKNGPRDKAMHLASAKAKAYFEEKYTVLQEALAS